MYMQGGEQMKFGRPTIAHIHLEDVAVSEEERKGLDADISAGAAEDVGGVGLQLNEEGGWMVRSSLCREAKS